MRAARWWTYPEGRPDGDVNRRCFRAGRRCRQTEWRRLAAQHGRQLVPDGQAITTDSTLNPAYTVAGVGMELRTGASLILFLRGDNIADTQWESALGYPGLPRSVMAGARFVVGGR